MALKPYMNPGDYGSFEDYPERPQPKEHPELTEKCTKCQGHGGWNLELNAYPIPHGKPNTPYNRHVYSHFRASCGSCWGHGWVHPGSCAHTWKTTRNVGNCLNEWTCTKCNKVIQVDSSG